MLSFWASSLPAWSLDSVDPAKKKFLSPVWRVNLASCLKTRRCLNSVRAPSCDAMKKITRSHGSGGKKCAHTVVQSTNVRCKLERKHGIKFEPAFFQLFWRILPPHLSISPKRHSSRMRRTTLEETSKGISTSHELDGVGTDCMGRGHDVPLHRKV